MRILIFFMLISLGAVAQPADEYKRVEEIAAMERDAHQRIMSRVDATLASDNFDVKYYGCRWEVDPAVRYIVGNITVYFVATNSTNSITLDLMNPLVTDSVKQRGNLLAFSRPTNALKIDFPSTINSGSLDSVTIYYKGIPATTGFGSFIQSSHAGVPVMWSLSEPYGSRDWWPCKNGLNDKADSIDIFVTNPIAYKAASNGLLQSEIISAGGTKITAHWKHRYPIASYLVCFAVTNYEVFNNTVQLGNINCPMQTYCYPESRAAFEANTQFTLDAMQLFHNHFGDYPFIREKYGHVQFGWGGGMEHQTATFIVNNNEALAAHELGHQWFGDKITCGSWEDIWLNEGFATYLAAFYMENKYPASIITNRRAILANITNYPSGSVKVTDTNSVNRIFDGRLSYNKGSYLLNMLRFKLGDSAFFKGIRQYQADPSLAYGFARTADLKRHLEQVSGQDLTVFFNQWYAGQGHPSYYVQWSQAGSNNVKIKMQQTTSDPSVTFFEMPVPLKFKNATQEKTVIVDCKVNGENFLKYVGFIPDTVLVDPEYWLISDENTSRKIATSNSGNAAVEVFPNPLQDPLTIYLHDFKTNTATISLYNMAGQLLMKKNVALINGTEIITLNTNHLPRGQYALKVFAEDFTYTQRLIK
ncbi:MAG TPA: M1 family aminopeptidase [Ferruginibacter sp.]|nr:M1 family aminopeptidase [Ferruginibacter sp.]